MAFLKRKAKLGRANAPRDLDCLVCIRPGYREPDYLMNHNRGGAHALAFDEVEQDSRMVGIEPDATMRRRSAKPGNLVRAVDRVAAIKEYRVRHRRIVIHPGEPLPRQHLRMIAAGRRDVAAPCGRNSPLIARHAVDADRHGLIGAVDIDDDGSVGAIEPAKCENDENQDGEQVTHAYPRSSVITAKQSPACKASPKTTVNRDVSIRSVQYRPFQQFD